MPTTQKSISKHASLAIVTGIYVLAAAAGVAAYLLLPFPWWLNLLYAVTLLPGGYLVCLCGKWLNNGIACRLAGEEKE